jgi:hypothetical protein
VLSLREHGQTMRFKNSTGNPIDSIAVDQCWLQQQSACDYLVFDWDNHPYLVELKGSDVEYAYQQLQATLNALVPKRMKEEILCFVIARKFPPIAQANAQKILKQMRKQWPKVKVHTHSLQHEHCFA